MKTLIRTLFVLMFCPFVVLSGCTPTAYKGTNHFQSTGPHDSQKSTVESDASSSANAGNT